MKLESALKKEAVKQRQDIDHLLAVNSAQKLLNDAGEQDIQMLKDMGMHSNAMRLVDLKGKAMEVKTLDATYGQVYTEDEIKQVAIKYALRFLRSDNYKGVVDSQLTQKVKEFCETHDINKATLSHRMFILAPHSSFKLMKRPVPVPPDPIAFYKLNDGTYRLIHQWGNDLSLFRQIIGWKYTNSITFTIFWVFLLTSVSYFALSLFTRNPNVFAFLMLPILIFSIARTGILTDEDNGNLEFMDDIWNENVKNAL